MIKSKSFERTLLLIVLIAVVTTALLSFFVISKKVSAPTFNSTIIQSLDSKKVTVMKLAAAAAASSTALSLIPGDAAMPIANQIAELSSYFIIVLSAILLEKMLLAVVGYVSFTYIIPIACILGVLYLITKEIALRNIAIKLAIFGIVLFVAIPISIHVSDLIQTSYQTSIEQTVETVKQNEEYIEEKKNELYQEDKNWFEKMGASLSNLTSKIGIGITDIAKKGEDTLSEFLETIAVLIITNCVIPIGVLVIFAWITKIFFGFDIKVSLPEKLKKGTPNIEPSEPID